MRDEWNGGVVAGSLSAVSVHVISLGFLCLRSLLEIPLPTAIPTRIHFVGFVKNRARWTLHLYKSQRTPKILYIKNRAQSHTRRTVWNSIVNKFLLGPPHRARIELAAGGPRHVDTQGI